MGAIVRYLSFLSCLLMLTACGASASATANTPSATATPTTAPTVTPYSTPPSLAALGFCGTPYAGEHGAESPLLEMLPASTPPKPFVLQGSAPEFTASFVTPAATIIMPADSKNKPYLELGFGTDCGNTVTINALRVKLVDFQPFSGPLQVWSNDCTQQNYYTRQQGAGQQGCGGDRAYTAFNATFAANAQPGDEADVTVFDGRKFPQQLPIADGPPTGLNFIQIGGFTAFGTYTFELYITAHDNQTYRVPIANAILTAPITQNWDGQSCLKPTMLAQIPATATDKYICPSN